MFDHVGIYVADLARSAAFYRAALAPLGYSVAYEDAFVVGLGPEGAPSLWLHAGSAAGARTHVALRAPSRAAVANFYAAAREAGGEDNGAPGLRPDYGATYYAAFVRDPDGHNVEAVFHGEA
ncbi:MAG: VOC family protein [Myxococcales bacterium]|nr:VOC family protein [Myxococcales bacterium]